MGAAPVGEARVRACLDAMRHRGPDGAGTKTFVNAAGRTIQLLHTRLSIIDLDARSNQPFAIGSQTLIYNGELYNYVELRRDLEAEGVGFTTSSDTEVLLRAIQRWGWAALDRFEGMWAFALYDAADGSLTFSRDRFGEKPLYLFHAPEGIYFGSEIKFIASLRGAPFDVDVDHLYRYLVNGYKALYKRDHAFFRGVCSVPPGSIVRLEADGGVCQSRYWTPRVDQDEAMSYDEAVAGARERLLDAVGIRLRADVPLAFCMSGGVDSNTLIAIARRVFDYDVHGFTIQNSDARYEEQEMVDYAVSELGIRHTAIPANTDAFLPKLRRLIRAHDAPIATISYFAHWLLMEQIAAGGYKIAVSGTAADELFTGYYDHHLAYLYEVRDDPERYAAAAAAWRTHVQPVVRNPLLRSADAFVRRPAMREHIYFEADAFAGYLVRPWREPFVEEAYSSSLLRNRMLNELFHESVPVMLHEDDLNAMSFSIENRSPFLDRRLVDFAASIPSRHLVRDGFAKAVLRDAMRGIVPDRVLDSRRKVGFNAPIHSFLDTSDPDVRAAVLEDGPIFDHVRRAPIAALLDKPDLPNSESKFLFSFVNAKLFLEEFAA